MNDNVGHDIRSLALAGITGASQDCDNSIPVVSIAEPGRDYL